MAKAVESKTETNENAVIEVVEGTETVMNDPSKVIEVQGELSKIIEEQDVVCFINVYSFEGKKYDHVDLSGIEELTAKDMIEAQKVLDKSGGFSIAPEITLEYACLMASKATMLPLEFFYSLRPKDAARLKNRVIGYFFGKE